MSILYVHISFPYWRCNKRKKYKTRSEKSNNLLISYTMLTMLFILKDQRIEQKQKVIKKC